jgi:hypothetical protein
MPSRIAMTVHNALVQGKNAIIPIIVYLNKPIIKDTALSFSQLSLMAFFFCSYGINIITPAIFL